MKFLKLSVSMWLLIFILLGSFAVRLYKIDNPVADWHSWRQADTAAVSRNFYKEGFTPFIPKYDDMSVVSEIVHDVNLNRYRFVEFPISNTITYFGYIVNGGVDERIARMVSVLFSLGSLVFIYFITKKYADTMTAIFAAFFFGFLPYNIYFSRVILPEPSLVFFSLGMVYFVDRYIWEDKKKLFVIGLIFTVCALLTKPYAVFYGLPLVYSYIKKYKRIWPIPWRFVIFGLLAVLPIGLWRIWILQHPEGIPASTWLLNGNGIRFRPAFWRWIVGDRLTREILSGVGFALFFFGVVTRPLVRNGAFLHFLLLGCLLFVCVFATGNVQHDYYQTFIIPGLVIFLALGITKLLKGNQYLLPRLFTIPIVFLSICLVLYLTWGEVKGLYQINNFSIVTAGRRADQILPKDAKVIAPYQGDTSFLYQTNRSGFPFMPQNVGGMINQYGMTAYVSVNYDPETAWIMKKYVVLESTPEYVIIDLTRLNPDADRFTDSEPI